jgi:hypothetical protein
MAAPKGGKSGAYSFLDIDSKLDGEGRPSIREVVLAEGKILPKV